MKKKYRVHVPAVIAFDVVAESEGQAKRIAAAAAHTPVQPMFSAGEWDWDNFLFRYPINLSVWAATYDRAGMIGGIDGTLTGDGVEILDTSNVDDEESAEIEAGVKEFAEFNANQAELAEALKW